MRMNREVSCLESSTLLYIFFVSMWITLPQLRKEYHKYISIDKTKEMPIVKPI
jgi:hypothetical protein